ATALSTDEATVLRRVQELIDERIIRQVTPIFDTRAFGYSSMLVAAKVDPEHPWGPAKIINSHPGVSHNYLRNHEFNMWFTIAVGVPVEELLAHLEGMVERKLLRRVAAILFHRRAGFSANGMGVWRVPDDKIADYGPRMAAFRGISHCYERPTYEDWRYQIFT